jgi:hypothetical protein
MFSRPIAIRALALALASNGVEGAEDRQRSLQERVWLICPEDIEKLEAATRNNKTSE